MSWTPSPALVEAFEVCGISKQSIHSLRSAPPSTPAGGAASGLYDLATHKRYSSIPSLLRDSSRDDALLYFRYRGENERDTFHELLREDARDRVNVCAASVLRLCFELATQHGEQNILAKINKNLNTAFHFAASYSDDLEVYKFLVEKGPAALLVSNSSGETPLQVSRSYGRRQALVSFLEEKTEIAKKLAEEYATASFDTFTQMFAMYEKI